MSMHTGADAPARVSLSERLQDVTETLAAARTPGEVFAVVLQPALEALNAVAGAVLLVGEGGKHLEIAATQGYEKGAQTLWQDGPLDGNVPAGDALRRHEALFFEHEGDLKRVYPELEARTGGVAAVATAALPMFLDERPLGTLILDFKEPHEFTPEEKRFLRTLASQCAIALGRARATHHLEEQVRARTRDLARQNAELEAILGSLPEAVYVGGVGGITRANPAALEMLGFQSLGDLNRNIHLLAEQLQNRDPDTLERIAPEEEAFAVALGGQRHTSDVLVRHLQTGEDRLIRSSAAPVRVEGQVIGAVAVNTDLSESRQVQELRALNATLEGRVRERTRQLGEHNAELGARSRALERFAELARRPESSALTLIRQTQEAAVELIGEGFSVYYELEGGTWRLRSQVGHPDGHTDDPRLQDPLFGDSKGGQQDLSLAWESGVPLYQDRTGPDLGGRSGGPDGGPDGEPETLLSTAVLPLRVGERRQGLLGYGLQGPRAWSRADRAILETVVYSLGLALERAEHARALEEERAALSAFARFTEESTQGTDPLTLAAKASAVLRATLNVQVGYSELEGGLWKGRVFSETTPPEVVEQARQGFPADLPSFARPFQARDVVFVDGWDARAEGAEHTGVYGAAALYPYFEDGRPHGLLTMGSQDARAWTERERTVFRAVGRSLALAFERAATTRELQAQNAELEARTHALEGFADLTRDLSLHREPLVLIERALGIVSSLLPPGAALFYRKSGDHWQKAVQVGDLGTPDLQAAVDAGLPVGHTPTLDQADQGRRALFQDVYDRTRDTDPQLVSHLRAVAALPVLVGGEVFGIFNVVLFESWRWSPADRAVLETTVRSLGLAIEGARGVEQLAQRTRELERSNAELEQFAYIASHDLQAPIRAVTSFAGLIERRYGAGLDDRGRLYLRQIVESGEHMKRLVDDLLALSRVHTQQRALRPVDSGAVFGAVAGRLGADQQSGGARLSRGPLPRVLADAGQLDQLLQNLISNGLKYHRQGVPPEVHVSAARDGGLWRFAVRDNGIGIEPEYFGRIFEIFQRLHGREQYGGTGIGLAVCKKIVERHGGQLWLESTPGEGSTFFFTLPGA